MNNEEDPATQNHRLDHTTPIPSQPKEGHLLPEKKQQEQGKAGTPAEALMVTDEAKDQIMQSSQPSRSSRKPKEEVLITFDKLKD